MTIAAEPADEHAMVSVALRGCVARRRPMSVPPSPFAQPELWNELHAAYEASLAPRFSIAAVRGIERVAPEPTAEVLDVGCGPGTLSIAVAPRVRAVVAVDFAEAMLALLEAKCRRAGITNITATLADGAALPFADARFDAAFSCFGLFLFADRAAGLAELRRVVKPGARVMLSSWTPPEGPLEATYRLVREALPDLPFVAGRGSLASREEILGELAAAGFASTEVERVPVPFSFASATDFWRETSAASAPLVAARRQVGLRGWPAVEARITEGLRAAYPGRVEYTRDAWVAVARRPAG
jgi:SAM-dependent methyltransferase